MRINLRRGLNVNKDYRRKIYLELVNQLISEYDLEDYNTKEWLKTPAGREVFVKWLNEQGYKVKAYTWPNDKDIRSQGFEFDDNDPLIIALKLKYSGDE